jgi:lipoprotein-releasing system permease protein
MFQPVPIFVGLRYSLAREHSFFVSFITWVSLLGVAVGVAILIVVLSVMNGLGAELRDRLLSTSAHATLSADGAAIPQWRAIIGQLEGAPGLLGAAPFLDTDAMLSHQPAMSGAIVRGVDPATESSVSTIAESMREGRLTDLTSGANRIVLGRMLAYQLEAGVGDTVTVMTPGTADAGTGMGVGKGSGTALDARTRAGVATVAGAGVGTIARAGVGTVASAEVGSGASEGAGTVAAGAGADTGGGTGAIVPILRQFTVSGIFEVGLQEHDSVLALVNLQDAQALRGMNGPTGIRLKFDDVLKAPALAREAAKRLHPALALRDWTQENEAYFRAIRIEKTMMSLILMLIVAVAVFNIAATLVMVVSDKRTDIAILRTLGMSPRGVLAVFMTQGVLIGWIGTAFGVALGLAIALNVPFLEQALDLHIMDPDVYYISAIPSETRSTDVAGIALSALLLTFIATIYPALQAARTQPAEALRYE